MSNSKQLAKEEQRILEYRAQLEASIDAEAEREGSAIGRRMTVRRPRSNSSSTRPPSALQVR